MSINLDMDIGELLKNLLPKQSKATGGKGVHRTEKKTYISSSADPYRKSLLIGISIALLFVAFMYGVYLPYSSSVDNRKTELTELQGKQIEVYNLEAEAKALERDLVSSLQHYRGLLEYFGDHEDIGNLYEALSTLALENNLVVIKVREIGKVHDKEKKYGTVVRKAEVEVELEGSYMSYMKFKESLMHEKALLSIFSENIKVVDNPDDPGKVSTKLRLLTYTIDKLPFEEMITGIERKREVMAKK